jgi:hypothetical protein
MPTLLTSHEDPVLGTVYRHEPSLKISTISLSEYVDTTSVVASKLSGRMVLNEEIKREIAYKLSRYIMENFDDLVTIELYRDPTRIHGDSRLTVTLGVTPARKI